MADYEKYVSGVRGVTGGAVDTDLLPLAFAASRHMPITDIRFADGEDPSAVLMIYFADGLLTIRDDAQSCCETRYMSTDDDLPSFVGEKLVSYEIVDGPNVPYADEDDYGDVHEQTFVKLETTGGTITLVSHNEHNGYYGGISILARWEDA